MNPADTAFVRQALQALRQALTAPAWSEVQRALLALERVELAQPRAAEPIPWQEILRHDGHVVPDQADPTLPPTP
jgi:hypothetical protein